MELIAAAFYTFGIVGVVALIVGLIIYNLINRGRR